MFENEVISVIESDEWGQFEADCERPVVLTVDDRLATIASGWKAARKQAHLANQELEQIENGIRGLFETVPVGRTAVMELGNNICALLKTHQRMGWDQANLKAIMKRNRDEEIDGPITDAVKVSIDKKAWERLPNEARALLTPALAPVVYDRLTYAEYASESEAQQIKEKHDV
jgi:hypothetical protein